MDEYPVNHSEPDTSVNAGRPGRSYFPQRRIWTASGALAKQPLDESVRYVVMFGKK